MSLAPPSSTPQQALRSFAWAFVLLLAVAIALYLILTLLGIAPDKAATAAIGVFGAITFLQQLIDAQLKGISLLPNTLVPFEGYTIPTALMVLYCTLIFGSMQHVFSGLLALATIDAGVAATEFGVLASWLLPLMLGTLAYILGRWIGRRCARRPFAAVALSIAISTLANRLLDEAFTPVEMRGEFWGDTTYVDRFIASGILVASFIIVGAIGVWRGSKARVSGYLAYLLDLLPRATRETIMELAYDEARTTLSVGKRKT